MKNCSSVMYARKVLPLNVTFKITCKHTEVKNHTRICDTCGKCFTSNLKLYWHIKIHTGDHLHESNVCDKLLGDLDTHMRTQTGETHLYKCIVCHTGFNTNTYLLSHMKSQYVGIKPYNCGVRNISIFRHDTFKSI